MELYELIYHGPKVSISLMKATPSPAAATGPPPTSFAVPAARFGYTEVRIGFIPAIVMVFLARKIGEGKARERCLLEIDEAKRHCDTV